VRQPEKVAMRPALTLAVLHAWYATSWTAFVVYQSDRAPQSPTPATELLDVAGEQEQVRAGAGNQRQRGQRGLAALVVPERGRSGEGEQGGVLLRRAAGGRHGHDLGDQLDSAVRA
jgi:hypothetical protein